MRNLFKSAANILLLLWLISVLLFLSFRYLPGDPATAILGLSADQEKIDWLHRELGLDQPLLDQYTHSISGIFSKDKPLRSIRYQEPVLNLIGQRLGLSLSLALLSFVLIIVLALPLALLSAYRPFKILDWFNGLITRLLQAIPAFFLGMLLSLALALIFNYRQTSFYPSSSSLAKRLLSLLLPAFTIALPKLSQAYQFLRDSLVAEWSKAYVLTAKSQGGSRSRILISQILPNSLVPFITASGLIFTELLTTSLVVEQVFKLPGLGRLLFSAVSQRDFPLAQTIILFLACLIIISNRSVDLLNRTMDPRLRRPASADYSSSQETQI